MTDDEQSADVPETPEIAEVRRLLADARHTEPMPVDVAARMDDVLAGLRAQRPQAAPWPREAEVIPIAAHRRRRAAALLLAAAAVVVGAVVVAPHGNLGSNHPSGSSAQDSSGGQALGSTGNGYDGGNSQPPSPMPEKSAAARVHHGRFVVRPMHFSDDALAGRTLLLKRAVADKLFSSAWCAGVPRQTAGVVAAEYQHAPAALVYRRSMGGSQVVDLFVCGNHRPVRSTTLPAP